MLICTHAYKYAWVHIFEALSDKAFPQVIVFGLPKIAVQTTPLSDIPNL